MESTEYQLNIFLTYVRTKQFCLNALKKCPITTFVHIPMKEIQKRYLVNPKHDIKKLIDAERIEVRTHQTIKGNTIYYYKALEGGYYDLRLLTYKGQELTPLTSKMMYILNDVTITPNTQTTEYFKAFLDNKNLLRLFFNVDVFSGRVHTPVTSLKTEFRKNLLIDNKETTSIDVVTMQPLLLGKILNERIGINEYSNWINEGQDIYIKLQEKANISTREEAKTRFFEILFSKTNNHLTELFGNSNWIAWVNDFKSKPFEPNPHTFEKNHSNLAWLLQNKEVEIMQKVWTKLLEKGIKFLSVHDEIIIQTQLYEEAKKVFTSVMDESFQNYKLSNH
jgi:hypothetical protein